eukprot:GDKH01005903.1.p1 GENE.GDKH01005903.1~~GDKH01005903.1.p1  ORF type:complete len:393 (+),score=83.94 GDKH01005903.1:183-1361(+)
MERRYFCFALLVAVVSIPLVFLCHSILLLSVLKCVAVACGSYWLAHALIPTIMEKLKKAGLAGKDLNKQPEKGKDLVVPEALGIVIGMVFLISGALFQTFFAGDTVRLLHYNAALFSICFMILLGFVDDVIDLPWRYKMVTPAFASLPLLLAYSGPTRILIPGLLRSVLGEAVDLGGLYYCYMGLLAIFCTNSINILAGVNGLEVGQSVVIAVFAIIHNVIEIRSQLHADGDDGGLGGLSPHAAQHLFSLLLALPFVAGCLALLSFNWFPSRVFVGDTFTYYAGMFFAVSGILGHYARTLLLFFIPQILNFLISTPQLFGLIPCPRHRIPKLNPATGRLEPTPNLTIINLLLRVTGPLRERDLTIALLFFQLVCCSVGLAVRYSPVFGLVFT